MSIRITAGFAAALWLVACGGSADTGVTDGGTGKDGGDASDGGRPPAPLLVAHAGNDRLIPPGELIEVDGSGSFALPTQRLTYLWSQLSGTPVTLSDPSARAARFRAPADSSDIVLALTVSDGERALTDSVRILVRENTADTAPFALAGADLEARRGETVRLDASESWDREPDALTFAWYRPDDPERLEPLATGPDLSLTLPDAAGPVVRRVEVSDGLLTAKDDVVVHVRDEPLGNSPPLPSATYPAEVDPGEIVVLWGAATDPEDDSVRLTWRQVYGPSVDLEVDGRRGRFVSPRRVTPLGFLLLATDDDLDAAPYPVAIEVTAGAGNRAPVADAGPDVEVTPGGQVLLDGSGSFDPDGTPTLLFEWLQIGGPLVTLPVVDEAVLAFPAPETATSLTFSLSVSDGIVSSKPDTVRVTVLAE